MGRGGMKYLQECTSKGTHKVPRSVPRCVPRSIPWSVTRSVAKSVPQSQSVPRWWGVKDHEACRSHWSRMISFGPSTLCIISPATWSVLCYKMLQRAVQALLVWQTRWSAQIGNYDESLFKRPRFSQSWVGGTPPDWDKNIYVNWWSVIYFNFYQYLKHSSCSLLRVFLCIFDDFLPGHSGQAFSHPARVSLLPPPEVTRLR